MQPPMAASKAGEVADALRVLSTRASVYYNLYLSGKVSAMEAQALLGELLSRLDRRQRCSRRNPESRSRP